MRATIIFLELNDNMQKMQKTECSVCAENRTTTQMIACPGCSYSACKKCVQRYILSSLEDPHCMNCKRRHNRSELISMFSNAFVNNSLKNWRKRVLFQRELAKMPATQPYVEQERQRRQNLKLVHQMEMERSEMKQRLHDLENVILTLRTQTVPPLDGDSKRSFVHRCTQGGCRGFLSTAWKCNVCAKYTCSQCNEPLGFVRDDLDHVCNESARETMRMLRNDSKLCPGCGECIHRVSGCDQMWCTMCATAFSWQTGMVINGATIHNPHYYDYMIQRVGQLERNPGDIPCGGMPTYHEIITMLKYTPNHQYRSCIINTHRLIVHIQADEILRYQRNANMEEENNRDLRILYTLHEINEDIFCQKIQQREKALEKCRDIFEVLQLIIHVGSDHFRDAILKNDFTECMQNIMGLFEYSNQALQNISHNYSCVVPQIDIVTLKITTKRVGCKTQ